MGIMVYSLLWLVQDLYHQPYGSLSWYRKIKAPNNKNSDKPTHTDHLGNL